ncbi:hypothetical protein S40285_09545 [Stachybotrys chlorohalonatus IBT 40285]|uniref:Acyl-CoA desaturase n=1 Tax=Stachybotrys chlorohalonatus (strain IBT 40285) TaxID=1283841 RepID=A0A084QTF8_STAC4|nr:hypothetical protein S40285_09545 [Stachybotrys chlorohalonata IBT 40285]
MGASTTAAAKATAIPDGTTDYKPMRFGKHDPGKVHISELPMTRFNWYKHINWLNTILIIFIPMMGFVSSYWVSVNPKTLLFAVFYYYHCGLGITAGYHRLWAHSSYKANTPLKIYLAACGAGAVQGSARWWSMKHRAHHRYTDTVKDPCSVRKGLLYSHIGWMVLKQNPQNTGRTDITDLNEDPVLVWQHRHYLKSVITMALIVPTLVCGLGWGDWLGGYVYAGILRICFLQQATFCVNSLAHWLGEQPFDDRNSPRDHLITALVTLGEGYHNFHHEFPSDYRNAIEWYQYDPTKWAIVIWKYLGLAYDLKQFRANEIERSRVQQMQKKLDKKRTGLDWGTPLRQLPVVNWDDYVDQAKNGKTLIAVAGVIHDVTDFIKDHPGGKALITSAIGKDATAIFNGGVYNHSNAAHNLLSTMRFENKDITYANDSDGQRIVRAGSQVTKVSQPVASVDVA